MIPFPFVGPTDPGSDRMMFSANRTVNLFPEMSRYYKNQVVLDGFPGCTQIHDTDAGPCRGIKRFKDQLIIVCGDKIYSMNKDLGIVQVGSLVSELGRVTIDENGIQAMIVDGVKGYWSDDGKIWKTVADTNFTDLKAKTVAAIDGMFLAEDPDTRAFYASVAYDPTDWSGGRTASAEFKGGTVNRVFADRELYVFTESFTQVFYNAGISPMPWVPIRSARILYGCAAPQSVAVVDNSTHFLARGDDGGVFLARMNGYNVERISSPSWGSQWATYDDIEDAYAMPIQWRGHEWYLLTFPQADTGKGRTFLHDASVPGFGLVEIGKYWPSIGDFGRWPMNAHGYINGVHIVADGDGKIYTMDEDVYTIGDDPLISLRRAPVLHANRERMFFNTMQIDCEVGSGGTMMLDISDDGGRTFDNRRYKTMGTSGQYDERVIFRQLGSSYDRVFQASVSDSVHRKFLGGYLQ